MMRDQSTTLLYLAVYSILNFSHYYKIMQLKHFVFALLFVIGSSFIVSYLSFQFFVSGNVMLYDVEYLDLLTNYHNEHAFIGASENKEVESFLNRASNAYVNQDLDKVRSKVKTITFVTLLISALLGIYYLVKMERKAKAALQERLAELSKKKKERDRE